ncbi:EI24 domain-containing protein [Nocardioides sp. Leaf374]|uniref:EI24 domain-containing protein n=1 Tax=Nocardioides sp. Leaf374 TaxID=2876560 RepID=UPI001E400FEF|nr:EI24 domain-containing protein [Nocardioides sp. Leaf374]
MTPLGFGQGVAYLGRGFAMWRRRPGLMALGMVPALIVLVVVVAALVGLLLTVDDLVGWATPFADGWADVARVALRVGLGVLVVLGFLLVASLTFTGLTLAVGDPFYERIWRETETMLGGEAPGDGLGFWRSARDAGVLVGLGLVTGLLVLLIGLLPVVGAVVGAVLGVVVSGRLLAAELVSRPLEARGIDRHGRRALLREHRAALLGLGTATQLCFLVPLGAVVVMPAAVVASTCLARDALDAAAARPVGG